MVSAALSAQAPDTVLPSAVSYLRVSTSRQGVSGLGLEAQRKAVQSYVSGRYQLLEEFVEVESGKSGVERPQLRDAIGKALLANATLVISKLDRLSRDAAFLLSLQNSGVKFVAADMPEANFLTVGLFAVIAEHERRVISERTRAALAAAKARGTKLGAPVGNKRLESYRRRFGNKRAVEGVRRAADDFSLRVRPLLWELISREPDISYSRLASKLEAHHAVTRRGRKTWSAAQVQRLCDRLGFEKAEGHRGSNKVSFVTDAAAVATVKDILAGRENF